jgi:catechol 2,3-dioxygenase-like lactoylglutathione lyase family enzyme
MSSIVRGNPNHPAPALRRIDHLICGVPDIERALEFFHRELGFPIAWPIGRFWPGVRTCGIALGGLNLEFMEPDEEKPERATITTMAFEPTSLDAAEAALASLGIPFQRGEKVEPDPVLLRLRGFPDTTREPQHICTNLVPEPPIEPELFVCSYSPFLKERLAPENPALAAPHGRVERIVLQMPEPTLVMRIAELGYLGDVEIEATKGSRPRVSGIKLASGPLELGEFPADFRFI